MTKFVESLDKGQKVLVEGRLQIGNAKMDDGSEKRVYEIDASTIELMSGNTPSMSSEEGNIVEFSDELISEDEIPF